MTKQQTKQPTRAVMKPGAVFGNQSNGYLNPNARTIARSVGRLAQGSPSAAKHAASGKSVFETQILK
jgi:hypothetical protein